MEIKIGIVQTMRELEVELADDADVEAVVRDVEAAIGGEGVLWLTDRRGKRLGVPASRIAYVEFGSPHAGRAVGFGAG